MSTKKEMLGKESRKEKGHRRYSLLLLALLFIGFASYGTYAYFTSSTSTQHGHLTLNGSSDKYDFNGGGTDEKGKITHQPGDGLADADTPVYHNPGKMEKVHFQEMVKITLVNMVNLIGFTLVMQEKISQMILCIQLL